MKVPFVHLVVLLVFLLPTLPSFSQTHFETSYLNLQLPKSWSCTESGNQEWLCRSKENQALRRGFISLKAKLRGTGDTPEKYYQSLSRPISKQQSKTNFLLSRVINISKKTIKNQNWIEALHQDSEVKNYFTQYLITTKGDLAILAQFNWHKDAAYPFPQIYKNIIKTLELKKNLASVQESLPQIAETTRLIPNLPTTKGEGMAKLSIEFKSNSKQIYIATGILALALVGFALFYFRRKR